MFNQNLAMGGLNSYSVTLPEAGPYFIEGKVQAPKISRGDSANSSVIYTITNATGPVTIYTSQAGDDGFYVDFPAAAGDVITIAATSSADVDQPSNAVKCEIALGSGQ